MHGTWLINKGDEMLGLIGALDVDDGINLTTDSEKLLALCSKKATLIQYIILGLLLNSGFSIVDGIGLLKVMMNY